MRPTIAVIDDDRNILTTVSIALQDEGFDARCYPDGEQGLAALKRHPPDLAVLDIKMPRLDGLEVLARLRRESALPVILLTSKDDELDEVLGLKMGADDYIVKPFSMRLLIERARALLRRSALAAAHADGSPGESAAEPPMERGDLTLDRARHRCTWKGRQVALTVTEFLLLTALAVRPGHVKSRHQLMDAACNGETYEDDRIVDSHIKRMRRKFRAVDGEFAHIRTLYGIGYSYGEG